MTTRFRKSSNECHKGNQRSGLMRGAAFMDSCQNVAGQLWKAIPANGGYFRLTTMFREGDNECLEGNQVNGSMNCAAFMDNCQNVTGQFWKIAQAALAVQLKSNSSVSDIQKQLATGIVNLNINFELNSDNLTSDARRLVSNFAKAIAQTNLNGKQIEVQGHTDASGSDSYNLDLSERRAFSVTLELIDVHGISANMMTPVGYGETRLFDRQRPQSGVNRRGEAHVR